MAENNTETKSIQLEENEIMRLSVRMIDSEEGKYMSFFASNGPMQPMVEAIMQACEQFELVCLPAAVLEGIPAIAAICCVGPNPFKEPEEGDATEGVPEKKE